VAELDGGQEPEEPPAEVDAAERLLARDRCNPQSGPCCSGAASAVRRVASAVCSVEEQIRNRHRHIIVVAASRHSTYLPLPPCPKGAKRSMTEEDRTNMSRTLAAVGGAVVASLFFLGRQSLLYPR
jgi:hypothetical protein